MNNKVSNVTKTMNGKFQHNWAPTTHKVSDRKNIRFPFISQKITEHIINTSSSHCVKEIVRNTMFRTEDGHVHMIEIETRLYSSDAIL